MDDEIERIRSGEGYDVIAEAMDGFFPVYRNEDGDPFDSDYYVEGARVVALRATSADQREAALLVVAAFSEG